MEEEEIKFVDEIHDSNADEELRAICVLLSFQNDKLTIHLNNLEEETQINNSFVPSLSVSSNTQEEINILDVNQITMRLTGDQAMLTVINTLFDNDDIETYYSNLIKSNDKNEIREESSIDQNIQNDFEITNRRKHQKLTGDQLMYAMNTILNSKLSSKELSNKLCLSISQINRIRRNLNMKTH